MTVLQAVAVAGGQLRATDKGTPTDTIKLQSELQALADDVLRSTARIARFDAELSDAKEITLPADLGGDNSLAVQTMNQEKTIFAARQNELGRQTAALSDLTALYRAQLDVLDQKSQSIDDQLKQAQEQLDGVKQLVHNGTITISRQTDLERAVSGLRSDHLDNLIATMSARQGLNEATRNLAKLEDDHRSEVSQALQTEQTNLEKLRLTQTTTMRLLRQSTEFAVDAKDEPKNTDNLVYTIVREQSGQAQQVAASDSTMLAPGDLVKVAVNVSAVANGLAAAPAVPTNAITTGSLQ